MRIEAGDSDDLDALADLWVDLVESQRAHGAHLLGDPNRATARDVLAQYVVADDVLVARTPAGVVGFVMFHVETGIYDQGVVRGLVDNLYVRPSARDQGVGSALLEAAEDRLAAEGAEVVCVSALAANDAARRLYERRGYRDHRVELEKPLENDNVSTTDEE